MPLTSVRPSTNCDLLLRKHRKSNRNRSRGRLVVIGTNPRETVGCRSDWFARDLGEPRTNERGGERKKKEENKGCPSSSHGRNGLPSPCVYCSALASGERNCHVVQDGVSVVQGCNIASRKVPSYRRRSVKCSRPLSSRAPYGRPLACRLLPSIISIFWVKLHQPEAKYCEM